MLVVDSESSGFCR